MSDTDIYKKREPMPLGGNKPPKKGRRRRSASKPAFDEDHMRKRRSKNTGFRRLLHLSRKESNEKFFWGSMGVLAIVLLLVIGIWQFVVVELLARQEETQNEYIQYQPNIPSMETPEAESPAE